MDHMEYSIALPHNTEQTKASMEWNLMKQRMNAHTHHSTDTYHQYTQGLLRTFLISIASEQVQELYRMFNLSYEEAIKFDQLLKKVEDLCLPRLLIIYNRFKFFTCRQSGKFDHFLEQLLNFAEFCEFGDLKDILLKDCIITGISDDSVRLNLLRTEELDFSKTVEICRAGEKKKNEMCDACMNTVQTTVREAETYTQFDRNSDASKKQMVDASTNTDEVFSVPDDEKNFEIMDDSICSDVEFYDGTDERNKSTGSNSQKAYGSKTRNKHKALKIPESSRKLRSSSIVKTEAAESLSDIMSLNGMALSRRKCKTPQKMVKQEVVDNGDGSSINGDCEGKTTSSISHAPIENFLCSLCGSTFPSSKALKKHLKSNHNEENLEKIGFKCTICDMKFHDKISLRKHKVTHKGQRRFKCEVCPSVFTNASHLKVHVRLHTGERPFACNHCSATFPEASKLKAHQRKHTGERPYSCTVCGQTFKWTSAHTRHMRTHTGERPYTCEYCGSSFADFTSLHRHTRTHTKEKPYACDTCPSRFADPSALRMHKRKHTGERPYVCTLCQKTFSRPQHLKEHTKLHTGEKPHTCETCGDKFAEASKLKSHKRKHTGEKPYVCKTCGMSFAWTAAYARHLRTHTQEKPYICGQCGSSFADYSTLRRHTRTHTGERPYPCKLCGSTFADSSSLQRHLKIHTGVKSHTCEVCGSSFYTRSYLTRHMRTHTGEKPFVCTTCNSCFVDSSKLKRHSKVHERKGQVSMMSQQEGTEQNFLTALTSQQPEVGSNADQQLVLSEQLQVFPTGHNQMIVSNQSQTVSSEQHPVIPSPQEQHIISSSHQQHIELSNIEMHSFKQAVDHPNLVPLTNVLPFDSSIMS